MRTARIRNDRDRCYYHLINRVAGQSGELPFGDHEKEHLFTLIEKLQQFYTVELISAVIMSNHFHLVCCTSPDLPDAETVRKRYRAYYGTKRRAPDWSDPAIVTHYAERMRNVSNFMKDLQQHFTTWFNDRHDRLGRLWADRFKSVILGDNTAVWECVKYIEMNPVRAGICADPADYRYSTWGRYCGSGKHPFAAAFYKHIGRAVKNFTHDLSFDGVTAAFRGELARVAAAERGESSEETFRAKEQGRRAVPFRVALTRRVRYWSDGAIIGSREFVDRFSRWFFGDERTDRKRFEPDKTSGLVSFRQLRKST